MLHTNKDTVSILQTKTLKDKVSEHINCIDYNWLGNSVTSKEAFIKEKYYAHVNRVLLWLSSKTHDYVRSSLKGGVLYELLGKLASDTNLVDWEEDISYRFNKDFAGDLSLSYLKLTTDKEYRTLYVQMIIKDELDNKIYPLNTEITK